ncbi:hypothetical protein B0E53_06413 [Micromonospora sp. MH33]|nr:hypothetical protein B0E53_06413 [Micromonospora sp. MH33]
MAPSQIRTVPSLPAEANRQSDPACHDVTADTAPG